MSISRFEPLLIFVIFLLICNIINNSLHSYIGTIAYKLFNKSSQSPFPHPMAYRAAPSSVSLTLGHTSANAVKATAGSWSTGSSASLTFSLHSHMSSARREGSEYQF